MYKNRAEHKLQHNLLSHASILTGCPNAELRDFSFFFFVRYILSLKLTSIQCQGNSTNTKLVLSAQASLIIQ